MEELEAVGRGRRGHRYVLGQFDGNEDGNIISDELLDAGAGMLNQRVDGVIEHHDTDNDGNITLQEVTDKHDVKATEHWATLLEKIDTNNDGVLGSDELEEGRPQRSGEPRKGRAGQRRERGKKGERVEKVEGGERGGVDQDEKRRGPGQGRSNQQNGGRGSRGRR